MIICNWKEGASGLAFPNAHYVSVYMVAEEYRVNLIL